MLPTVKKAELLVVNDDSLDHEYLPIDGDPEFIKASLALVYGSNAEALASQRVCIICVVAFPYCFYLTDCRVSKYFWYWSAPNWS